MLAIVQARLNSFRLPGKMLMELSGRVVLGRVLDQVAGARRVGRIVVATSQESSDDGIADFCRGEGVICHRGPLDDVAERFRRAAREEAVEAFVRVNGDSPLIDPALIDRAIAYYEQDECDLVTNVFVRSFPKGQSVEVLRFATFDRLCAEMIGADDKEHVTKAIYENPAPFRIVSFTSGVDAGAINMSIDTREDFDRVAALIAAAGGRAGGWRELLARYLSSNL